MKKLLVNIMFTTFYAVADSNIVKYYYLQFEPMKTDFGFSLGWYFAVIMFMLMMVYDFLLNRVIVFLIILIPTVYFSGHIASVRVLISVTLCVLILALKVLFQRIPPAGSHMSKE